MPWDYFFWVPGAVLGCLFALLLAAGALVSVLRSCGRGRARAAWTAVVLLVPVLGPVLWFACAPRYRAPDQAGSSPGADPAPRGLVDA
jgi:H+/Cl- antiporter ClcA